MRASEIYKYNPRQIPAGELRATFVARQAQLESVLDELRGRARDQVNQHLLVLGPRGIGKTNFLLMIRYAVVTAEDLEAAYLPVQTAEEEYSIAGLRDLFDRVCELLIEDGHDGELAAAREAAAAIRDDDHAAEVLIAAVKALSERQGRKILLLVDNLDLILDQQLGDDAELGRLRDLLMNESFLVLVGAAPTYFKEVSGYDRPFYNFFRPVELEELTPEQMGELLRRHAELDDAQPLLERFEEIEPQLKVIHHMTGGNPRLVLVLYQLSSARELPEVRAAIEGILDSVTPYYKARLEALSPQQRRLMDTFARLGHPATPSELAGETRLPANQVSSLLKRLESAGFVTVAPQKRRRSTLYMVSERIFRIWHQMRFSGSRKRLEFLIEFLRMWYTHEEWFREAGRLLGAYRSTAEKGDFAAAESILEDIDYVAEAAPEYDQGFSLVAASIVACLNVKDLQHAEEILADRRAAYARENRRDELSSTWVLTAGLRMLQGRARDFFRAGEKSLEALDGAAFAALAERDQRRLVLVLTSISLWRLLGQGVVEPLAPILLDFEKAGFVADASFIEPLIEWLKAGESENLDRLNPEHREVLSGFIAGLG